MDASKPPSDNGIEPVPPCHAKSHNERLVIPGDTAATARIGTWQHHLRTDEVVISAMLAHMTGLPAQRTHLSRQAWQSFVFPDDLHLLDEALQEAIQTDKPIDLEYRLLGGHGSTVWVLAKGLVIRDLAGKPIEASGVLIDITATKNIEALLRASEERYRHLAEMSPDGIMVNVNGKYVYANQAAAAILGTGSPELILGRALYDFLDEAQRAILVASAGRFFNKQDEALPPADITFRRLGGMAVDVQVTARWTTWEHQPAIQIMLRDVTELKQAQNRLRATSERLHIALESAGEGIWDWDMVNDTYAFSSGVRTLLALAPDEVIPACVTARSLIHPEDARRVRTALAAYLAGTTPRYDCEFRIQARDGQWKWVLSRGTIVSRDAGGKPLMMTGTMSDITEKKTSEATVWRHANLDALTGVPNRRLFRERLEMALHRSRRYGHQVAILYLDLDRFKEVNDLYGHDAGDMLLTHAVQRMQRCVRQTDTIARLGGDEFAIMMTDLADSGHVEFVCQSLLATLSDPFQVQTESAYVTASIGVAVAPLDAVEADDLLRRADQAMFVAKRQGKNQFCYFMQSMDQHAHHKLRISNDLRHALHDGQMTVHYQPIVDLSDGRIAKAEALLRWRHPTLGVIEPALFIPCAEEAGLIGALGDWVFEQAAQAAQRWSARTGSPFQVSINKSPMQLMRRSPEEDSLRYLDAMHLAGSHIAVEITEGMLLHALPNVIERLQDYRNAGIQVAIDDFGTGYSSMAYLQKFQIDYLKIDQSFIRDISTNPAHRTIAETMILMAHKLGLKAIAEGVETQAQHDVLAAAGCDYAQGFLFSRPLPPEQFERMLPRAGAP